MYKVDLCEGRAGVINRIANDRRRSWPKTCDNERGGLRLRQRDW